MRRNTHRFGQDEGIRHQVQQGGGGVNVVEGVRRFQAAVQRVVHDGGGQSVETQEISHLPIVLSGEEEEVCSASGGTTPKKTPPLGGSLYLDQVRIDNVLLGQQPVFYFFLAHGRNQVELAQVLLEEAMHQRHVLLGHRSQTLSLWSLKGRRWRGRKK